MKVYILLTPDYDGDHVEGVFSSWELAEAAAVKGYPDSESLEVREFEVDPLLESVFAPVYSACRGDTTGRQVTKRQNRHDCDNPVHNEHVWHSVGRGVQTEGLGFSPEAAIARAEALLVQYKDVPETSSHSAVVIIPRPDLVKRTL